MDDGRRASFSLRRWSRRKLEAARQRAPTHASPRSDTAASAPNLPGDAITLAPVPSTGAAPKAPPHVSPPSLAQRPRVPLPPVESLTIDSDFSPFMQSGVDEGVKREALRKLVRDPRFNVMDGLDVYIDDYSKPSPLEPALARALVQARYVFDPPKTRVTAEGIVEDVPERIEHEGDAAAEAPASAATDVTQRVASLETRQREEPDTEPPPSGPSRADERIE